jgi:hypothetical protein
MVTALDTKFENLVTNYTERERERETRKFGRGRDTNTPHDNTYDFISIILV